MRPALILHDANGEPPPAAEPEPDPGSAPPPQPEAAARSDSPYPHDLNAPPPGPVVELNLTVPDADPPLVGWLDIHLAAIAVRAGVRKGQISLAVVDDPCMARLHEQYRQTAGTTDVLSFDLRARPDDPLAAEVVVCLDEARRQAGRRGHETRLEALLYAVHGLLHMIGYEDATADQADRMHEREDQLLNEAGFGPVFARAERSD